MLKRVHVEKADVVYPVSIQEEKEFISLLRLVQELSEELDQNPKLFVLKESNSLRILYLHSCYDVESFIDNYGVYLGNCLSSFRISLNGLIGGIQDACIRFIGENQSVTAQKWNTTGRDFNEVYDLYIKIECSISEQCLLLADMLQEFQLNKRYIAFNKATGRLLSGKGLEITESPSLGYAYLDKDQERGQNPPEQLASLSFNQILSLWNEFLLHQNSPAEFDWQWTMIEEKTPVNLYLWEIALKMALEQNQIQATFDNQDFQVRNQEGNRIHFDNRRSKADKMFLKFIFPEN